MFRRVRQKIDEAKRKKHLAEAKNNSANNELDLSILFAAAEQGNSALVVEMLVLGAGIDAKDSQHRTPLLVAVARGKVGVVKLLLENGANYDYHHENNSALTLAAHFNCQLCLKALLKKGANVNLKVKNGATALHYAAFKGHTDIVTQLLEKGAALDIVSEFGETPLKTAIRYHHWEVVEILRAFKGDRFEDKLDKIHYKGKIPDHLICPIKQGIFNDPITVSNGQTYDRDALSDYFEIKGNPESLECPVTRTKIYREELKNGTAVSLKGLAEKFVTQVTSNKLPLAGGDFFRHPVEQKERLHSLPDVRPRGP